MRNATGSLLPVLAALFAIGVLGMPERAAAQPRCDKCLYRLNKPPKCVPTEKGAEGYEWCKTKNTSDECELSSEEPDCNVVVALDGRAVELDPGVAIGAVGRPQILRWVQFAVSAVWTPPAAARQACASAIVHRRYSPPTIAEIRAGLRRVTI